MIPENAKTHAEAIEALVAASLRPADKQSPITEEEISRYVNQQVTLSAEDEAALEKAKASLVDAIKKIIGGEKVQESVPVDSSGSKTRSEMQCVVPSKRVGPSPEFIEAIVISQLTRLLSSRDYPLGRFRYNKFAYFSHRRADEEVTNYFRKKAAGPYSRWARYQGPEAIALKNRYVRRAGKRDALLPGDKIDCIDPYLSRYPVCRAIDWVVETFRYMKNEQLELLATVDFAAVELKRGKTDITWQAVKAIIGENREWAPKLNRAIFSDSNILQALSELRELFPATYSA
jgi:hypothetical protein